jgi:hypothetical protein
MGEPAGSNAIAGLALRVTGTHKPFHHDKVDIYIYIYSFMSSLKMASKSQNMSL